ncbi:tol [Fusarium beomiforme]|uniref:Tol n=1 Tax=Fusarium beomiforme TaxID=44412 RepID=A0A9P5A718_9HYPO|nr:tol [Fusarium beomiforme]
MHEGCLPSIIIRHHLEQWRRVHNYPPGIVRLVVDPRSGNSEHLAVEDILRNCSKVVGTYSQGQLTVVIDKLVALSRLVDVLHPVFQYIEGLGTDKHEPEHDDKKSKAEAGTERVSNGLSTDGLSLAGLWRPYVEMQLVWRASSSLHTFQFASNAPPTPDKRYDEYVAPTWSWYSLKYVIIEPQKAWLKFIYFAKLIDAKIVPRFDAAAPASCLRYCSAPESILRMRCSFLPIASLEPGNGMKAVNSDAKTREAGWGDEASDVESKNY